jgi:hypothetical protein
MTSNVTDRLAGASSSLAFKAPCRVATTANITLSGYQTIDGVLPTSTEHADLRRILVKNQTNGYENGIYVMDTGAWVRARDFDGVNDFRRGTWVFVWGGSTQSGAFRVTSSVDPDSFVIDTDTITFTSVTTTDVPLSTESSPTLGADLDANGYAVKFDDATGIKDDSGNEQLMFQKASTAAANYLEIYNSTAGDSPTLAAAGDDTNIGITLLPKGSGTVNSTAQSQFDAAMTSSAITASGLVTASAGLTATTTLTSSGIVASGAVYVANSISASSALAAAALKLGTSTGSEIAMYGSTAVVSATSATTGTDLLASGISYISSAETTWRMDAPVPGLIKHVFRLSTTTATTGTIQLESGAILSSAVSTGSQWTMTGVCGLSLVGVTTALYSVVARFPTTSQISIT